MRRRGSENSKRNLVALFISSRAVEVNSEQCESAGESEMNLSELANKLDSGVILSRVTVN
jgi:hypothetical protein